MVGISGSGSHYDKEPEYTHIYDELQNYIPH